MKRPRKSLVKKCLTVFAWLTLGLIVTGCYVVDHVLPRVIVAPQKRDVSLPTPQGLHAMTFHLDQDIKLRAWMARPETPRLIVIVLHGIGDSKASQVATLQHLATQGYIAVGLDLRAHGDSEGDFATYGFVEKNDLSKVRSILHDQYPHLPIGIWGTSYGGAVALQSLGNDRRFAFGIIESTFANLGDVVDQYGKNALGFEIPAQIPERALTKAGEMAHFDPKQVSPETSALSIRVPILHMHGARDENIPISHAYRIGKNCTQCDYRFEVFETGGHFDLHQSDPTKHGRLVDDFLKKIAESRGE
jgi:alpha-beta hydrolase superfamily lysophospholipase